ncbi:MAG TPA: Ig-like domain-containing protein [Streptosporangiaceae bacterium]|nr:Ig-like domain-containing protein [Streptosporangiaceae bacterium]
MRRRVDAFGARSLRLRRSAPLAGVAVLGLLVAACSGGSHSSTSPPNPQAKASSKAALIASTIRITPANGTKHANPSDGITVTALRGTLGHVSVRTADGVVPGSFSNGHKVWHSQWTLGVSQTYKVSATSAGGSGTPVTATSRFRTLTPGNTFQTQIFEGDNQTYGVGMPIILTFSQPITNKAAVESALQVRSSKKVIGSWYWDGSQTLNFRPRDYWPAGTTVTFTGHLDGVQGAPGMYGYHTLTQTFNIGSSLVAVANTRTHRTQIYYNGKLRYNWPISTGRPGDATPNGSYLTIEKHNPVRMKGPGYNLLVPWSVRFTFSGDYYHDAYWSVNQQGFENVSHGCVNLSPAHAKTYYQMAVPGDPITVIGSPKGGKWDNGWTEWFMTFQQYLQGSALHEAVKAGPDGSKFVSPTSLPASKAKAPLETSPAGNSAAS